MALRINLANLQLLFLFLIARLPAPIKQSLSRRWNKDSTACRNRCTNKLLQGMPGCEHTAHHMLCRSSATCSFSSLCPLSAQTCTLWNPVSQEEFVYNIYLYSGYMAVLGPLFLIYNIIFFWELQLSNIFRQQMDLIFQSHMHMAVAYMLEETFRHQKSHNEE